MEVLHSELLLLIFLCVLVANGRAASAFEPLYPASSGPSARVVSVEDPEATEAFEPRPEKIRQMVDRAITRLTGKSTVGEAWRSIISGSGTVPTNEVIGLKVFSAPGPHSGTRPAVVGAVVQGLLAAGVASNHIVIWDRQEIDLRLAGFFELGRRYGVRVAGAAQAGYDEKEFYETPLIGNLVWGDLEFGKKGEGVGRRSFFSKLVSQQITKIINITPLLNNNYTGVSGNLYSLALGGVDNIVRFESDRERLATAVPELYAKPELSDRVVLNITDALICQYEGSERSLLHYSATLNQLRFSRDPVALDVLSLQELDRQRQLAKAAEFKPNVDLYTNASLLELGVSDPKRIQVEKVQ